MTDATEPPQAPTGSAITFAMMTPADSPERAIGSLGGAEGESSLLLRAIRKLDFPVVVVDEAGVVRAVSQIFRASLSFLNLAERESLLPHLATALPGSFAEWLAGATIPVNLRLRQRNGGLSPMLMVRALRLAERGACRELWLLSFHLPESAARQRHEREILLRISSVPIPQLVDEGVALAPERPERCPITRELLNLVAGYLGAQGVLLFRRIEPTRLALIGADGFESPWLAELLRALAGRPELAGGDQGLLAEAAADGYTYAVDPRTCTDPTLVELLGRLPFYCSEAWVDGIGRYGAAVSFFSDPPGLGSRLFATAAYVRLGRQLESANYSAHMYEAFLELRQTQDQIIQSGKMAALGELTTGIAHELRQPVTAINNFLTTVFDHIEAGRYERVRERIEEYRQRSRRNIDRISRIIDHLRTFSRQKTTQFRLTDLRTFFEEIYHTFLETQLKTANISVSWDFPPDLPQVEIDPAQIEQVLLNLISNARDAVESRPDPRIAIVAKHQGGRVRLTISDNGTGVAQEHLDKVMNPFFSTKAVGKGTGVGLSISHGIVRGHEGHLEFHNNAEGGASFTVDLPLRQAAEP